MLILVPSLMGMDILKGFKHIVNDTGRGKIDIHLISLTIRSNTFNKSKLQEMRME